MKCFYRGVNYRRVEREQVAAVVSQLQDVATVQACKRFIVGQIITRKACFLFRGGVTAFVVIRPAPY